MSKKSRQEKIKPVRVVNQHSGYLHSFWASIVMMAIQTIRELTRFIISGLK